MEDNKVDTKLVEGGKDAGQGAEPNTGQQDEVKQTEPEAKFNEKDLNSYADKRVTEAIKKKEAEFKKEVEKIKKELEMSKMSEKERLEEERKMREQELEEREREISERQLRIDTLEYFNEEKLSNVFLEIVEPIKDLEARKSAVKTMQKVIEQEVSARVKEMEKGSYTGVIGASEPLPKDPREALRQTFKK